MEMLGGQTFWFWLIAGILLCGAEAVAPGLFMLWLGVAALGTGLLLMLFDPGFAWSLMIFGALSAVAVFVGARFYGSRATHSDQPFLNRRAEALVGRTFMLDQPIHGGEGRIVVNDTQWRVRGLDAPAGAKVRVVKVEDAVILLVEPG